MAIVLPTLYGVFVALCFIDARFGVTGHGESNWGAWLLLLATVGAVMLPPLMILVVGIQLYLLYLLGGRIDALAKWLD
jgi:hypothetical protein